MTDCGITEGIVVALCGEFDIATRRTLTDAFEAVGDRPFVIVDLERTRYIDSTALSRLMQLRSRLANHGGTLVLAGASAAMARLIEIAGLLPYVDVAASPADAQRDRGLEPGALARVVVTAES